MATQATAASEAIVDTRHITKIYHTGADDLIAVNDVSLAVHRQEFVAIMGPSGSGKSTFMNVLGCLDKPSSGSYLLAGRDVSRLSLDELADIRGRFIGFVFQGFNLLPRTTALENVELPLVYGAVPSNEREERARRSLELVGLGDRLHHRPNELSGGQQQRVAIARALVNDPVLILADEPTGNLDSKSSTEIMSLFTQLNKDRGITIIIVTHDLNVAGWARRIVSFSDGRIVEDRATPHPAAEALA
jgi:putative ABC transport system ATP-binding protein